MNPRLVLATAARVLRQLVRDRRTMVMILAVPPLLLTLLKYVFNGEPSVFERLGAPLVGLFPLILMFLVASIAMLRERTSGTLERLMSTPVAKFDLLAGYGTAFALVALVQACLTAGVAFGLLGLSTQGPVWAVMAMAVANAILGMSLGLLLSAFARSEFQAIQFMPAALFPQLLLAGLFAPRASMPSVLQGLADVLPATYAFDGLSRIAAGETDGGLAVDVIVVIGCVLLALGLGALTLRRRTG